MIEWRPQSRSRRSWKVPFFSKVSRGFTGVFLGFSKVFRRTHVETSVSPSPFRGRSNARRRPEETAGDMPGVCRFSTAAAQLGVCSNQRPPRHLFFSGHKTTGLEALASLLTKTKLRRSRAFSWQAIVCYTLMVHLSTTLVAKTGV